MPSRKRVILIATILIVLILAILLALFLRPGAKPASSSVVTPAPATTGAGQAQGPAPTVVPVVPPVPSGTASVQTRARLFAERYGSYSTEADFANLKDALSLMTDAFAAKTQTAIQTAKAPALFYGVTTRAVSVKMNVFDATAGTATVTVSTQRQETIGSAAPVVKYQDLVLTFQKVGDDWKVASATWK